MNREKKEVGKFGGVLCEFDQNSKGQDRMNLKNRKSDSWKRRARANSLKVRQENEKE